MKSRIVAFGLTAGQIKENLHLWSLLNGWNDNCDILLVSRFEFTGIMTTSFQLQSHKVVSYQHSISCIKTLSVGFPALCLLLHNRSIGRKVQTRELDIVDETVALDAFEKEMKKCFNKVQWNGCGSFFIMKLYSACAITNDSLFLTKRKWDWSADFNFLSIF